jgi:hypothetical protein
MIRRTNIETDDREETLETVASDEAPADINRIACEIEAQDDIDKQKPEMVNIDVNAPVPLAQVVPAMTKDSNVMRNTSSNDTRTVDLENENQRAQPRQQIEPSQHRHNQLVPESAHERTLSRGQDPTPESFDLPLLEATLVEEPTQIQVQPTGPIYDAIYVPDEPKSEPEPQSFWKSNQKVLFAGLLLVICILVATIIGVTVTVKISSTGRLNPQQVAEPVVESSTSTELAPETLNLMTGADEPAASASTQALDTMTWTSAPSPAASQLSSTASNVEERPKSWIEAHNTRRQYYHETVYGESFVPLVWSDSLAQQAQEWADEQNDGSACSAGTEDRADIGQTGYAYWSTDDSGFDDAEDILTWWVDEEEGLDWDENKKFTQAIWRASKYLGCGDSIHEFEQNRQTAYCRIYVCNYIRKGEWLLCLY